MTSFKVNAEFEVCCDVCGERICDNLDKRRGFENKFWCKPCSCQTAEIEKLKERIEELQYEIERIEVKLEDESV